MKKLIICLLVAITLTNCEVGVRKSNAEIPIYHVMRIGEQAEVVQSTHLWKGMQYMVLVPFDGGPAIINLTKDSLEVELLRKQIEVLNKNK